MGGVAKAVSNAVDSVVTTVGDAVDDVGDFIVDDVVKPVVKAVDNTIEAIKEDPLNAAIQIGAAAMFGPAGLAIANGTIALAKGASLQDAALSAGKAYVVGQAGAMAGAQAGALASEAGYGVYAANAASGATAGATRAALTGGDLENGVIMGTLGGVSKVAAKDINDTAFEDWARGEAEKTYDNAPSPTEQDVLAADPSIKMDFPLETPVDQTNPGYFDEETGKYIESEYGQHSSPLGEDSGMPREFADAPEYDGSGQSTTFSSADTSTEPPAGYDPLLTNKQLASGLNFAGSAILRDAMGNGAKPMNPLQSTLQNAQVPLAAKGSGQWNTNWLGEREMIGDSTGDPYDLMKLRQLYETLTPEMQQTLATNNGQRCLQALSCSQRIKCHKWPAAAQQLHWKNW